MSKILIRTDSSSSIGLGHVMRDLVYAKRYHSSDEVIFASMKLCGNIIKKIANEGYRVEILKTNKIDELNLLLKNLQINTLIIDHYGIDYEYEKEIKLKNPKLKLMVFDDTYEKHFADIIINHNLSADLKKYQNPSKVQIISPLIREEFEKEKSIKRDKIYDYFIALGGADTLNATPKILKKLSKDSKKAILTTTANKHLEELTKIAKKEQNITLHVDSKKVAKLLNQSKYAIITPSVMAHEVLFMGVPFLAIKTAKNQDDMYRYLKEHSFRVFESVESFLKDKTWEY